MINDGNTAMKVFFQYFAVLTLGGAWMMMSMGCNTIEGIGRDIQAIGQGASKVAEDVNPYEGEKK